MSIHWSSNNRKLKALAKHLGLKYKQVLSFDLPAGWTCPMADICKSKADRITGKITDGENCQFRCYAAKIEAYATSARKNHWDNFDTIRKLSTDEIVKVISNAIPENTKVIRIHASGDFFNKKYFNAWVKIAQENPKISFFGYTKVLNYVNADKPDNFSLVYSFGGKMDKQHTDEPACYVVENEQQAKIKGVMLACSENEWDDFHAIQTGLSFALLEH